MNPFDWHYEFLCAKCGYLFASLTTDNVFLAVGWTRLCPKCGAKCGSKVKGSVRVKKARYRKNRDIRWYKPWTWLYAPEKVVEEVYEI